MYKIRHILRAAFLCLPWLMAAPFAACSAIDSDVPADDGTATLRFSITAREEGDLNTRAPEDAEGEEVGTDHEYIHRLCVLIVGTDGTVVKKLLPEELQNNAAAQQGNLRTWQSEAFTLDAGTYTVYAFANIDTEYGIEWGSLTGIEEGHRLDDYDVDIDNIVLQDPVSRMDFDDYFIPMSARQQVTVTPATTEISVGLDRLVSKVRISLTGTPGSNVTALTFGGYADRIRLFEGPDVSGVQYNVTKQVIADNTSLPVGENGGATVADFYVNSSPANAGYTVTLVTDEMGGTTYTATTSRMVLPRNSIYPLLLQLQDFALNITPRCWLSPIGSYPVEVRADFSDANTYTISIPEGSQFEFTLSGVGSPSATVTSCVWSFDDSAVSGLAFDDYSQGDVTVKGYVTASAGQSIPLTCEAEWRSGGTTYHRTYTVNVETTDIIEAEFITSGTNAAGNRFGLLWLNTEMLNMSRQ